ncbi:MAG: hypothetical protein KGZ71_09910 [Desulfobulbaceae bacterium]|nr:hypothetical protein [Desulfobulbaceae bacterium]
MKTESITAFEAVFGKDYERNESVKNNGYAIVEPELVIFDRDALKVAPRKLYRFDTDGKRWYYEFLDSMNTVPMFYCGVTSSIASLDLLPSSEGLYFYYNKFSSMEAAKQDMQRKADYGSFIHVLISRFIKLRTLEFADMDDLVALYKAHYDLDYSNRHWADRAIKDLIAVKNWMDDYEVKPLATELVLPGKDGYATAVDLICEMTLGSGQNCKVLKTDIKNGTMQTVRAAIDFKTGDGFYETHEMQMEAVRRVVNENLPELKVTKMFNVSPKGITDLKCEMKDQTDKVTHTALVNDAPITYFDLYWEIFKMRNPNFNNPRHINIFKGSVSLDAPASETVQHISLNPYNLVIEKHRRDQ